MGKIGVYRVLQDLRPRRHNKDTQVYKVSLQEDSYVIKTFPKEKHNYAEKEFDILCQLRDINGIVNAVEIFEWNNRICLVENYVEGINLNDYIKTRGSPGDIITRLAQIFMEMHAAGIVHRDIKPANIILTSNSYSPIVIDFDNALRIEDCTDRKTNVTGSSYYMAPELGTYYKKKWMLRDYDWTKADMWSFGITAFLLTENKLPHKGTSGMFDFSDLLLFLTKCAHSDNPQSFISLAVHGNATTRSFINLALNCNWKIRPTFEELLR